MYRMAQAACIPYTKKPGDALNELSKLINGKRD